MAREDAWRRRVDQRALALDPPGWLVAELGPVPSDPQERAVWRAAAAELDGYRRAYGLDHSGPAKHVGGGWPGRGGRRCRPPGSPASGPTGSSSSRERGGRGERTHRRRDLGRRPAMAAGQRHQVDPDRLLGAEPRRRHPGRRRDWQAARAALERLAGWDRHRDHRDRRHPDRRPRPGRDLGRQERDGR